MTKTLAQMAVEILSTKDATRKAELSLRHAETWATSRANGAALPIGAATPPDFPARPDAPELLSPRDVPRRKPGSPAGRLALMHAIAHIELNAVDLHWDIIARYTDTPMPMGFYDDWAKSGGEEAKHFLLICDCLKVY